MTGHPENTARLKSGPAVNPKSKTKVLLACADKESEDIIRNGLANTRYLIGWTSSPQVDLFNLLQQCNAGILILQVAVPDKTILELSKSVNNDLEIPVVMFSTEAHDHTIEEVVDAGVSAFVVDGLSKQRIAPILDTAIARFNKIKSVKDELKKTKTTLTERKYIDRAKGLLIQHKNMSEDEAYSKLRKMAMESNKRIGQVAKDVINILETLS